ncbi:MAG: GntR family transcriptional regulator [Synergistales bacterium]|nr:GntR family transcriptional regulator [Synergistales bacterium]
MEVSLIHHETLTVKVVEYIRNQILFWEHYSRGERISESELSKKLGVSRTTIREALKELENQGLVESIPRKGSYVASFDREDVKEIFHIRYMLETDLFSYLIEHKILKKEDYLFLKSLVQTMVNITQEEGSLSKEERIERFSQKDLEFHQYLWEKTGRKWTLKMLTNLYYQLRLSMMQDLFMEDNLQSSAVIHYKIIEGFQNEDFQSVEKAYKQHILTLHTPT